MEGELPTSMSGSCGACINGRLYVFGGYDDKGYSNRVILSPTSIVRLHESLMCHLMPHICKSFKEMTAGGHPKFIVVRYSLKLDGGCSSRVLPLCFPPSVSCILDCCPQARAEGEGAVAVCSPHHCFCNPVLFSSIL